MPLKAIQWMISYAFAVMFLLPQNLVGAVIPRLPLKVTNLFDSHGKNATFNYILANQKIFTCPAEGLEKYIHNVCNTSKEYHCLPLFGHDEYFIDCKEPKRIPKGHSPVYDPESFHIDIALCPIDRYQPFAAFSFQIKECVFKKSCCNEEGQILQSIGSPTDDRRCICDYTRHYYHVSGIKGYICIPSQEDCSCYRKTHLAINTLEPESRKQHKYRYEIEDSISQPISIIGVTDRHGALYKFCIFLTTLLALSILTFAALVVVSLEMVTLERIWENNSLKKRTQLEEVFVTNSNDQATTADRKQFSSNQRNVVRSHEGSNDHNGYC